MDWEGGLVGLEERDIDGDDDGDLSGEMVGGGDAIGDRRDVADGDVLGLPDELGMGVVLSGGGIF